MTTTIRRANKLTIQASEITNGWVAKFAKTHEHIATIESTETTWRPEPRLNATANREMFRLWLMDNASQFGIKWDPTDRRTADNLMPAKYTTDAILGATAIQLVQSDIEEWLRKISPELQGCEIAVDEITPVTTTKKGAQVASQYKDGSWAWAQVRLAIATSWNGTETYAVTTVELVSGQLKKPATIGTHGYNYTGLREEILRDFPDLAEKLQAQAQERMAQ